MEPPAGVKPTFPEAEPRSGADASGSYGGTKAWHVVTYGRRKARVRTLGHWPELSVAEAHEGSPHAHDPKKRRRRRRRIVQARSRRSGWSSMWTGKVFARSRACAPAERYIYPAWATSHSSRSPQTVNELLDHVERKGASRRPTPCSRRSLNYRLVRDA